LVTSAVVSAKAWAAIKRSFKQLEADLKQIERAIDSYDQLLDENDAQEGRNGELFADDMQLDEKLEALKESQARKQAQLKQLQDSGETRTRAPTPTPAR